MNRDVPLEALIRHAINASPAVVFLLQEDPDDPRKLVPLYLAESFEKRFGYPVEEILGRREWWVERIHPADRDRAVAASRKLLGASTLVHEYRFRCADGRYVWIRDSLRALQTATDKPRIIVGAWLDITEQKEAELALAESEERYRLLLDGAADGIFMVSDQGIIREANEVGLRLLGGRRDQVVGAHLTDVITPESLREDPLGLDQLKKGEVLQIERQVRRFDGSEASVEIRVNTLPGGHLLATMRDITARRRAERQRARLEEQLRQSQKLEAIGQLAGGVAHDMNNILSVVDGMASLMKLELAGDKRRTSAIETILSATQRGAQLTHNLLGFARKSDLRIEPLSINDLVADLRSLLWRTLDKGITVHTQLAPDIDLVKGDANALSHALLNLALNACDAMDGSGKLIIQTSNAVFTAKEASSIPDIGPGDYVVVKMIDDGIGMQTPTLERAFEPFFTTKPPGQGTGLGLSMVYGTVRQHEGAVEIESLPGAGTTVSLYLPAPRGAMTARVRRNDEPEIPRAHREETVLVVDDEEMVLEAMENILERLGYKVLIAGHGLEALERYRSCREGIDLVIMDLHMPGMSGRETISELMKLDPELKILVFSGFFQKRLVRELRAQGLVHLLRKPFTLEEVAREVRTVLDATDAEHGE